MKRGKNCIDRNADRKLSAGLARTLEKAFFMTFQERVLVLNFTNFTRENILSVKRLTLRVECLPLNYYFQVEWA